MKSSFFSEHIQSSNVANMDQVTFLFISIRTARIILKSRPEC